ncbi:MAG: DnaB-like helicase C-terminal domain-containing protein [bacterium]
MSKNKDQIGYLGKSFQSKTILEILTDQKFGSEIIKYLYSKYFDTEQAKMVITYIKNFYDKYEKVPSLTNSNIYEIIKEYHPDGDVNGEMLSKYIDQLNNYWKKIKRGKIDHDGAYVQEKIWTFIKQQELKNTANIILNELSSGGYDNKIIYAVEDKIKKVLDIGQEQDFGIDVCDNIMSALEDENRYPIPTGIPKLDLIMNGGLGKSEIGIIIAPLGTGKSTILTRFASNAAYIYGKNVLQIYFEDTDHQILNKHFSALSGIELNELKNNKEYVNRIVKAKKSGEGKVILKKMSQEGITIPDIKKFVLNVEKVKNIKFDLILIDYLDCIESHKNNKGDSNKDDLDVIKAFESMSAELNIPMWSAVQSNRQGITSEIVTTSQQGGSIKKSQKAHFIMSIARSLEQKANNTANISILKSRIGDDGMIFKNCKFNNSTLNISLDSSEEKEIHIAQDEENQKLNSIDVSITNKILNDEL